MIAAAAMSVAVEVVVHDDQDVEHSRLLLIAGTANRTAKRLPHAGSLKRRTGRTVTALRRAGRTG
jgi:hypothetical protein